MSVDWNAENRKKFPNLLDRIKNVYGPEKADWIHSLILDTPRASKHTVEEILQWGKNQDMSFETFNKRSMIIIGKIMKREFSTAGSKERIYKQIMFGGKYNIQKKWDCCSITRLILAIREMGEDFVSELPKGNHRRQVFDTNHNGCIGEKLYNHPFCKPMLLFLDKEWQPSNPFKKVQVTFDEEGLPLGKDENGEQNTREVDFLFAQIKVKSYQEMVDRSMLISAGNISNAKNKSVSSVALNACLQPDRREIQDLLNQVNPTKSELLDDFSKEFLANCRVIDQKENDSKLNSYLNLLNSAKQKFSAAVEKATKLHNKYTASGGNETGVQCFFGSVRKGDKESLFDLISYYLIWEDSVFERFLEREQNIQCIPVLGTPGSIQSRKRKCRSGSSYESIKMEPELLQGQKDQVDVMQNSVRLQESSLKLQESTLKLQERQTKAAEEIARVKKISKQIEFSIQLGKMEQAEELMKSL